MIKSPTASVQIIPVSPNTRFELTGIENNLHRVLDVAFDEDRNRVHKGHSTANFAVIRPIALNLIKREKTSKVGVKTKCLKADWDNTYLLRVIGMGI